MLRAFASVVIVALCARAAIADDAAQRVVVADGDPELRHALVVALSPWRLAVVEETKAPADREAAQARAEAAHARFVVWREGDALVVFDRARDVSERRPSAAGRLAPPAAAAAALTVKTMMRLPPLAPVAAVAASDAVVTAAPEPWLRFELIGALRVANGDAAAAPRLAADAMVRASERWWFGALVEIGAASDANRASFKGDWRDASVIALAGWAYARGRWQVEPRLGLGGRYATLSGSEASGAHDESAASVVGRAELVARWGGARWTISAQLGVDGALATNTYHRLDTPAVIFHEPGAALRLGMGIGLTL